jgi:hypothetical protein
MSQYKWLGQVCVNCTHHFPKYCTRYVAYPNYMHMKTSVNQIVNVFYNKAASQIGTNVRARVFNVGLASSQFAS